MRAANSLESRHFRGIGARLAPAYSCVSLSGLFAVAALVLVFSFGRTVNDLLVSIRDGAILSWLGFMAIEVASHGLMALLLVLLIAPVISLGPPSGWRRAAALLLVLVAAASVSALVRMVQLDLTDTPLPWRELFSRYFVRFVVRYGYMAGLALVVIEFFRYEVRSISAMHGAEVDRLALDREMAAARLQVLQAQIEPHFLFNTLANVRRLYQTDAATGRQMLDNLMRYLEVALPRMRDQVSTLAREAALIDAFLNVQKIRMGRRLTFEIDIPTDLTELTLPPMMLLTLVENALKHGLNPVPEGGIVRVRARRTGSELIVSVADTGRGFGEGTSGDGTGLANIRARLSAMFGTAGRLGLSANTPRGITATLTLPLAEAASSVTSE